LNWLPFFAGFKAKLRRLTNAARTAQFRRNGPFGAAFAVGGGAAAGAAGGAGAGNAFASFDAPGCIMNSTRRGAGRLGAALCPQQPEPNRRW
jgi:hypothetical protein